MLETGSTEWIGVAIHKELKHSVVTSFLNNNLLKNDQSCTVYRLSIQCGDFYGTAENIVSMGTQD